MAVCQYFLRGECKFGDKCRFEHPQNARPQFGNKTWVNSKNNANEYAYTEDTMGKDLRAGVDKPLWGLSSYGPAKFEPNLITGLDMSFEELRVNAAMALQNNTVAEYMKFEAEKVAAADQVYANAFNNLKDAYKQATTNSDNQRAGPPSNQSTTTNAFGQQPAATGTGLAAFGSTTGSVFGSGSGTSALGPGGNGGSVFGSNSFGSTQQKPSVFGQTTQPTSVFGSTSTPGQTGSVFGQPSMSTTAPAFGTTSTPGTSGGAFSAGSGGGFSAFAGTQPSAFGLAAANNTGTSAFAQPQSNTQTTPALGNTPTPTSVFGQTSQPTSAFGGAGTNPPQSVFGAPANTTSAFGNAPTNTSASAFGTLQNSTPSVFGTSQTTTTSVFGNTQNTTTTPAFGQSPNLTSPAFGNSQQASAFGQPSALASGGSQPGSITLSSFGPPPTSAFGTTATNNPLNPPSTSTFGAPQTSSVFGQPTQMNSPFGAQPSTSAFGNSNPSQPSVFSAFGNNKSQPSKPDPPKSGPPDFQNAPSKYKPGNCKYDAMLPPNYMEILPADARAAFEAPKFEWGQIPEWIPPVSLR